MTEIPQYLVAHRIREYHLRTERADHLVVELKIDTGFLDTETQTFEAFEGKTFTYVLTLEEIPVILRATPNPELTLFENIRGELEKILLERKVLKGSLVG